jgi:hypothetical protein
MAKLTLGVFPDCQGADKAIGKLEKAGVLADEFSVIAPESVCLIDTTDSAEGALMYDVAIASVTNGGLAGLMAGAVATSGLFVTGPMAVLTDLGWAALTTATGAVIGMFAGGMVGALVGLGVPEATARHYEHVIEAGGILLGLRDDKVNEQEVRKCFERHGAEQIIAVEHEIIPIQLATAA